MVGIEETKEVLVSVNELGLVIAKHVKDGVSITDIPAIIVDLLSSDAFKQALVNAITNVSAVPAEIKDINIDETFQLMMTQAGFVTKFIDVLKK